MSWLYYHIYVRGGFLIFHNSDVPFGILNISLFSLKYNIAMYILLIIFVHMWDLGGKIPSGELVGSKGRCSNVSVLIFLLPEMLYSDHIQYKYNTINNMCYSMVYLRCLFTLCLMYRCQITNGRE